MRSLVLLMLLLPASAFAEEPTPTTATTPLSPGWSPLVVPASVLAPGIGHLLRGERRAGGTMLAISGISLGVSAAAGIFLGVSGASDIGSAIGVPILILGASTLIIMAVTDILGAFADDTAPTLADAWSARTRVSVSLLAPMRAEVQPAPELFASWRGERWLVQGRFGTAIGGTGPWGEGGGGVRVFTYADASPRSGLWVEASARYELLDTAKMLRGRVQLVSVLPMGIFGARLSRLTTILRLGLDPTWLWYKGRAKADLELPVSGGFEVRLTLSDTLRLIGGYEHARDGQVGGAATGFLGSFYGGIELALLPELLLVARADAGTPSAFTVGLEWRR